MISNQDDGNIGGLREREGLVMIGTVANLNMSTGIRFDPFERRNRKRRGPAIEISIDFIGAWSQNGNRLELRCVQWKERSGPARGSIL